ncbi:FG-GAP repeat protein [Spongisporangium articulatum]|uniref:FG-GAP repeat protein n=1 Tax=Spongisporangium articulatum TaxID=3362603 RepID=A0ABW8AU47_9ACTN
MTGPARRARAILRVALVVGAVAVTAVAVQDATGPSHDTPRSSTAPAGAPATPVPTPATAPRPTPFAAGDVPGLLAVGMPYADDAAGALDVFWPDGRTQHLTYAGLNLPAREEGTFFGASSVPADLNGDGRTDLVVAAPGNAKDGYYGRRGYLTEERSKQPPGRSGRVYILFASRDGFDGEDVVTLPLPTHEYDLMGRAIAVTSRAGGAHDVWVGAPALGVDGKPGAGRLYRVAVSPGGRPRLADELTEDSPGIEGMSHWGNGFGRALATAPGGVLVGMPNRTVDGQEGAGAVLQIRTDPRTGAPRASRLFVQGTYGLPDTPEKDDFFGSRITPGGQAVGVPEENLGKTANAGAVQLFSVPPDGSGWLTPGPLLTRDSPGVPDTAHPYESFGISLAVGTFACPGVATLAIGTSRWSRRGETTRHGGDVLVMPLGAGNCPARTLTRADFGLLPDSSLTDAGELATVGAADRQQLVMGRPSEHADDEPLFTGRVVLWRMDRAVVVSPLNSVPDSFGTTLSEA